MAISIKKLLMIIIGFNIVAVIYFFIIGSSIHTSSTSFSGTRNHHKNPKNQQLDFLDDDNPNLQDDLVKDNVGGIDSTNMTNDTTNDDTSNVSQQNDYDVNDNINNGAYDADSINDNDDYDDDDSIVDGTPADIDDTVKDNNDDTVVQDDDGIAQNDPNNYDSDSKGGNKLKNASLIDGSTFDATVNTDNSNDNYYVDGNDDVSVSGKNTTNDDKVDSDDQVDGTTQNDQRDVDKDNNNVNNKDGSGLDNTADSIAVNNSIVIDNTNSSNTDSNASNDSVVHEQKNETKNNSTVQAPTASPKKTRGWNIPEPIVDNDTISIGDIKGDADSSYKSYIDSLNNLDNTNDKMKEATHSVILNAQYLQNINPYRLLGFYKDVGPEYHNAYPGAKPWYDAINLGIKKNPSYCDQSDLYNIFNPAHIFHEMNFVGDYIPSGLPRKKVIEKIGTAIMPDSHMSMPGFKTPKYDLHIKSTMFFTKRVDFHYFHEIGKQFLCAHQMYSHIPGHGVITRKDFLVGSVNAYADSYSNKPSCFNKNMYFPQSYRLNNATECAQFFDEINSNGYQEKKKTTPYQYILKVGYGAHRASGVFMFDEKQEQSLRDEYENGKRCANPIDQRSLLAQRYIGRPLTLDRHNKFDFRMYMLIASVDPIIAFYHDGFLRVSLERYDFNSTDRNVHLTNTHLAKQNIAQQSNATYQQELADYQMWTLDQLQNYLLKTGKITSNTWLDDYLRPSFKKSFIHLVRMSKHAYWKHSSVYEMFGLDLMLDDDLNLWFIEANGSPQLIGTNPTKEKLMVDTLSDMFRIQYAYLRSKSKRMLEVIHKYLGDIYSGKKLDLKEARAEFDKANKNFLEPEFQYDESSNTWHKIIDENKPGAKAYMGLISDECVTD